MLSTAKPGALGLSRQRLFAIRKAAAHGDFPKESAMRTHLQWAGWRLVQQEYWEKE
jgi:hypothetical protein